MESQSPINNKNNLSVTTYVVNSRLIIMAPKFSDYLREALAKANIKPAELARRSGVTKQNIGRLLHDTRHPESNALPQTTIETVEKLAKELNLDLDEARLAAGFAPTNISKPTNAAEFLAALESLGVTQLHAFEGTTNKSPEEYERLLDSVRIAIEVSLRRKS